MDIIYLSLRYIFFGLGVGVGFGVGEMLCDLGEWYSDELMKGNAEWEKSLREGSWTWKY